MYREINIDVRVCVYVCAYACGGGLFSRFVSGLVVDFGREEGFRGRVVGGCLGIFVGSYL